MVINGWLSKKTPLAIISLVVTLSPKSNVTEVDTPVIVPTPKDSLGLKKTLSLTLDSK